MAVAFPDIVHSPFWVKQIFDRFIDKKGTRYATINSVNETLNQQLNISIILKAFFKFPVSTLKIPTPTNYWMSLAKSQLPWSP
jgi:hypothetical protein